jgi:protein-S-isoprenylcysteine O-methyltransferase Ste14
VASSTTTETQGAQQDPDTPTRIGGWLFRKRTSLPVPIILALVLIPAPGQSRGIGGLAAAGLLLVAAGESLRLWGVHHIGAISRTRTDSLGPLIDSGPFALVRNPLYIGNLMLWVGVTVSSGLVWLVPFVAVLLGFEYHAIVRWEERLLDNRMGLVYRDYLRRVPRWVPLLAAAPRGGRRAHASACSWRDTFFSERGTLLAIVGGYVLLALKGRFL